MKSITQTTETVERTDHHAWCEQAECIVGSDYASHYGAPVAPVITVPDTSWRCVPQGRPEIEIRPIDFDDSFGVEVNMGDIRNEQSTSGSIGVSWLTPQECREFAELLLRTAAFVEVAAVRTNGQVA